MDKKIDEKKQFELVLFYFKYKFIIVDRYHCAFLKFKSKYHHIFYRSFRYHY